MNQSHAFEAELLKPAPRELRARPGANKFARGCTGCFIVPHTLIGIGLILWLLWSVLTLVAGQSVPARIVRHDTASGEDGPTYSLWYSYSAGGATYEKRANVSPATYKLYPDGSVVSAKISRFTPSVGSHLQVAGNWEGRIILFLVPFSLFWNAILFGTWWALLGKGSKRLVREGIPAVGRVLNKRIDSGSYSDKHSILFEWMPPSELQIRSHNAARPTFIGPFATSSLPATNVFGASPFVSATAPINFKPFPPNWDDDDAAVPAETFATKKWFSVILDSKAKAEKSRQRIAARHTPGALSLEESVELVRWNAVNVGEIVTVLVDKRKPSRAIIYRISDWQAV